MSILIRLVSIKAPTQYLKVLKEMTVKKCQATLPNLRNGSRFMCSKTVETINLSVSDSNIQNYLNFLCDRYKNKYRNETLNQNNLTEIIDFSAIAKMLEERLDIVENINQLKELVEKDTEMEKMIEEEQKMYRDHLSNLDKRLLETILENLGNEMYENTIVEISAGVGGQEAMLFAKDLYEMYKNYANYLGLKYELLEYSTTDQGGVRKASLLLLGSRAFEKIRHEGGVHRVQRVPVTESGGRTHTSTVSVAILPEPTAVQITIHDKDLKIETKRSAGAGGQHVNCTDSAVRITHLPTGVVVTNETARSQIQNKKVALIKLRSLLYEQNLNKQNTFISQLRKNQMGMGTRNERIRTYNYNQDRITDHRLDNGTIHNLREFMEGGSALEELENKLHKNTQRKMLLELIEKLECH